MPININHNTSGNITLQSENQIGSGIFIFPNINGESTILISGSPISYISGLESCLSYVSSLESPFEKRFSNIETAIQQKTQNPVSGNYACGDYSIAFGVNACATYSGQIAQGLYSNNNCGWNQNSQFLFKTVTSGNECCYFVSGFKLCDQNLNYISYINGKVAGKGSQNQYAVYDFCSIIVSTGASDTLNLVNYTINTGVSQGGSYNFLLSLKQSSGIYKHLVFEISGVADTCLNWLLCMNDLTTRIS